MYFFTVFVFARMFHLHDSLGPGILVASAFALAYRPVQDKAQEVVDRIFFHERYDAQLMLQELSELAISITDINTLASLLLDRLTTTMHIKHARIMLRAKDSDFFRLVVQKGQVELGEEVTFRADHPVVQWLASRKQPLAHHDLEINPQFRALWAQEREDLDRIEAEFSVPLLVREELIGILVLGPKLSETPYSPDEQLTLTTLANQTAGAIQYAWLYSDLEQTLHQLELMQVHLTQAEKLSAIGEMIAGVVHEVRSPLTAIIGYAQLLQTPADVPSRTRENLERILEAGMDVRRIIADLLDFSRPHPPQKEYVDINQLIAKSLGFCAHELIANSIWVETGLAPDLPRTMADPHQLQQVFINIINNARQAMAEQDLPKALIVTTRGGEGEEGGSIRITFRDTGPGIPEEVIDKIFDSFFTTRPVGQGTGLGLSVSQGIVREHEGCMWAENEDDQGATFVIELPVRPDISHNQ